MTRLMSSFGDVGGTGDLERERPMTRGQKHVRDEAGNDAHFSETCNEVFDLRVESLCKKRRANMRRKGGGEREGEVYCQLMACGGLNLL